LLSNLSLDDEVAIALAAEYLKQFEDGGWVRTMVKRFSKDPWNRVQSEMDTLLQPGHNNSPGSAKLDLAGARELAKLLLDRLSARCISRMLCAILTGPQKHATPSCRLPTSSRKTGESRFSSRVIAARRANSKL